MTHPLGETLGSVIDIDPATELARLQTIVDAPANTTEEIAANLSAQQAIAELFAQHPALYRDTQLN